MKKEEIAEWVKGLKWSRYGEMDFTYNPPGEKEVLRRIGNAETNILLLAAMSSGMVSREAALIYLWKSNTLHQCTVSTG